MSLSRKEALKYLRARVKPLEFHLKLIAADPGHRATPHHRHEARNWIREMEEVLPYVGKKTGAEWKARIDGYWAALEA